MLKYPYYKDNPRLNLVKIKTVRDEIEYYSNCKKIDGIFYVKGIDLDYIDGEWVMKSFQTYDHELKKSVNSSRGLLHGIVAISDDKKLSFGYFSPNPYTNCHVIDQNGNMYNCINYNILNPKYYRERYCDGLYYDITNMSLEGIRNLSKKINYLNNADHVYNVEDNKDLFNRAIELYENSKILLDRDIKYLSNYIKDITFGVELETINGTLPQHIMNKYGIIICKDGSLKDRDNRYPPEYVTVPLKGAKGLQTLRNISKEISLRSDFDIKCSYHIHIGGMNIDRIFITSLFKLCTKIQDDVFQMFPYYKTDPTGIKEKNYCKKLPDLLSSFGTKEFNTYINQSYEDIFKFLTGGHNFSPDYNKHAKINPWGGEKWNIKTRYYWVNFVNPLFGKRDTIEFRLHTPTLNSDKIINWLVMCVAIIKFAESNVKDCISSKKISFKDVLNIYSTSRKTSYGMHLSKKLIDYYMLRVAQFKKDIDNGDRLSMYEITNDSSFSFNISKLNS